MRKLQDRKRQDGISRQSDRGPGNCDQKIHGNMKKGTLNGTAYQKGKPRKLGPATRTGHGKESTGGSNNCEDRD